MQIETKNPINLNKIRCNSVAEIYSVNGLATEVERLSSLGIHVGAVVRVIRGGITSIVELHEGSRLCLRTSSCLEILCVTSNEK